MYDAIRPYKDTEIQSVLERLIQDRDLLELLAQYRFPRLHRHLPWLSHNITRMFLRWHISGIDSVISFQSAITARYLFFLLEQTVSTLETTGLDAIPQGSANLYFSNHRDIVLDSALTNYCLYRSGHSTFRIATGDNLESIPFCRDLMKLNKSFWVNRSEESPKKKYLALKELSSYIEYSIRQDKESVWIAQREGRAKDSLDRSDIGVLKMLHLCARGVPLHDHMTQLNLRPVSISYEYDPCDLLKAKERHAIRTTGSYQKQPGDDMQSVITGLRGFKGRVHIAFGWLIHNEQFDDVYQLAHIIDASIINNYHLYPSNLTALRLLAEQKQGDYQKAWQWHQSHTKPIDCNDHRLLERYQSTSAELQGYLLESYANPCLAQWKFAES